MFKEYYCTKCKQVHRNKSAIGKKHYKIPGNYAFYLLHGSDGDLWAVVGTTKKAKEKANRFYREDGDAMKIYKVPTTLRMTNDFEFNNTNVKILTRKGIIKKIDW